MPGRFSLELVAIPRPALVAKGFFITSDRLNELTTPLERVSEFISNEIAVNFDVEGRPVPWEPLADSTVSRKASADPPLDPRILRATGALFEAVTSEKAWDIGMTGGNEAAAVLVDPTEYGWRHLETHRFMPIRDWGFVPDDALDTADELMYEWLAEDVFV